MTGPPGAAGAAAAAAPAERRVAASRAHTLHPAGGRRESVAEGAPAAGPAIDRPGGGDGAATVMMVPSGGACCDAPSSKWDGAAPGRVVSVGGRLDG